MKAEELRIGNWVHHKDNYSYRQPKKDFKEFDFQWGDEDWYALGKCTLYLDDITPIPLTEEWLIKFGFGIKTEEENPNKWTRVNNLNYAIFHDDRKDEWEYSFGNTRIQYVHQLQNLYFALTGTELTPLTP